ncbi:hypothetical protein MMC21_003600 [Puttea exsequens]|nr:hypothetical protein [Puttea exsequens]
MVIESIEELQPIGEKVIEEKPRIGGNAVHYARCYEAVEKITELLLVYTKIPINSGYDRETGYHRYDEAVLKLLRNIENRYDNFLGKGHVHEKLRSAKNVRKAVRARKARTERHIPRDDDPIEGIKLVERSL